MKEDFEKWFYRVIDKYLFNSLDDWQIVELKKICFKAYKKSYKKN